MDRAVVSGVCYCNGHRRSTKNTGDGVRRSYHAQHKDQSATPLDQLKLHADCKEVRCEFYEMVKAEWEANANQNSQSEDGNSDS